jgi:hypothetical protein
LGHGAVGHRRPEAAADDEVLGGVLPKGNNGGRCGHKVEELVDLVGESLGVSLVLTVDERELEDGRSGSATGGTRDGRSDAWEGSRSVLSGGRLGLGRWGGDSRR